MADVTQANPLPGQIAAGLDFTGMVLKAFGQLEAGRQARVNAERQRMSFQFAQQQAEVQASDAIAAGEQQAIEQNRLGHIEASRALAVAAASGASASDPTIVRLLATQRGETAYRAGVSLYEGEARARQLRINAIASGLSGSLAMEQGAQTEGEYDIASAGTIIGGSASLWAKYGMGKDTTSTKQTTPRGDKALLIG